MNFEFAPGVNVDRNENNRPSRLDDLVSPSTSNNNNVFKGRITIESSTQKQQQQQQEEQHELPALEPEEEEEEELSPPPPEPEEKKPETIVVVYKPYVSVGWLFQLLVFFIAVFLTTAVLTHMVRGGHSFSTAINALTSQQQQSPIRREVYPLWIKQHATKSASLTLRESFAKPLISSLEYSFRSHMETGTQYACLCMHHLMVPGKPDSMRICSVYNRPRQEMYLMINPVLAGRGNQTDSYEELSVSCDERRPQSTRRYRQVFLEWVDPATHDVLYAKFQGMDAVCLQLALDELDGNKHCV